MPNVIVVGAQWGDEGKGKIIDLITPSVDVVVRFQGGANAGHTVVIGDTQTILHLVPSGILHERCRCIIGNGVVVDPGVLIDEIEGLHQQGYVPDSERLAVSDKAHVVMPYHRQLDILREEQLGSARLGTTGRGIGPAYEDKVSRMGIRCGDLIDPGVLESRLEKILPLKNQQIESLGGKAVDIDELMAKAKEWASKLEPHICDTVMLLHQGMGQNRKILFEGAQGTALDIDHGTYPFVTSSNAVAGGALCGAGVGPGAIDDVVGIVKAYTTRVGQGPFPTALGDEVGAHLQERGKEFGATTGRRRRCGWLDAVLLRHAARVNGLTRLALTKLDVLSGLERLKVCNAYELDGTRVDFMPSHEEAFARVKPVYEELPGWTGDITAVRSMEELPGEARAYVNHVEELVGIPIDILSVGPERSANIIIRDIFS
jgi:adenylosuccinate synthase